MPMFIFHDKVTDVVTLLKQESIVSVEYDLHTEELTICCNDGRYIFTQTNDEFHEMMRLFDISYSQYNPQGQVSHNIIEELKC